MRSGCVLRSTVSGCVLRSTVSGCVLRSTVSGCVLRSTVSGCVVQSTVSGCVLRSSCELIEEAEVVLEEEADVVHAVLQHGDPLDAHAERPAGDLFGIVAHVLQHLGMHYPRAEDLQPARLAADAASRAGAQAA